MATSSFRVRCTTCRAVTVGELPVGRPYRYAKLNDVIALVTDPLNFEDIESIVGNFRASDGAE